MSKFLLEIITLQSARGRLGFAALAHTIILAVPFGWLSNLSLYKALGLDWMPSIGLTRAYWQLLHGHLTAAWEQNWLIFPVITVGWLIIVLDIYRLAKPNRQAS